MSVKRNWYGAIKRQKVNRDFRRKHAQGAFRQVMQGKREEESFGVRMRILLNRIFAV